MVLLEDDANPDNNQQKHLRYDPMSDAIRSFQ